MCKLNEQHPPPCEIRRMHTLCILPEGLSVCTHPSLHCTPPSCADKGRHAVHIAQYASHLISSHRAVMCGGYTMRRRVRPAGCLTPPCKIRRMYIACVSHREGCVYNHIIMGYDGWLTLTHSCCASASSPRAWDMVAAWTDCMIRLDSYP
jgi:hypothetical protein